jgi:hypothetical protein
MSTENCEYARLKTVEKKSVILPGPWTWTNKDEKEFLRSVLERVYKGKIDFINIHSKEKL